MHYYKLSNQYYRLESWVRIQKNSYSHEEFMIKLMHFLKYKNPYMAYKLILNIIYMRFAINF